MGKPITILCPFCLRDIPPGSKVCTFKDCEKDIPPMYLKKCNPKSLTVLSTVGFGGHGKTVYLAALLHALDQVSNFWKGFYRQALNMHSVATIRNNIQSLSMGRLPDFTQKNFPEPSIHRLAKIPQFNEQTLLIYDTSGESFESDQDIENFAGFIRRSHVAWFILSPGDLKAEEKDDKEQLADRMFRLLNIYTLGMAALDGMTQNQHLVIVYTKGDTLNEWLTDYPKIWEYINTSELQVKWDMSSYLNGLKSLSNQLRGFTRDVLEAQNFINLATEQFASVEFCIVSALGSAPVNGKLSVKMSPRRVLDPLLWAIVKSRNSVR